MRSFALRLGVLCSMLATLAALVFRGEGHIWVAALLMAAGILGAARMSVYLAQDRLLFAAMFSAPVLVAVTRVDHANLDVTVRSVLGIVVAAAVFRAFIYLSSPGTRATDRR